MLRTVGAVLVICSTSAMGLRGVLGLRLRVRALEGICASLELMESEICSRLAPMREVLEFLAREAPAPVRGLYSRAVGEMSRLGSCSFREIWRTSVLASPELRLRPGEEECLLELGSCLGRYDVNDQARTIARVRRRLEADLEGARRERDRDSRLHACFGIVSGIFAVIILL